MKLTEDINEYMRRRYAERRLAGLCKNCERTVDRSRSKSRCARCLDRAKRKNDRLKAAKKCLQCGRRRDNVYTLCDDCRARILEGRRRLKAERHEQGLCIKCGKPKFVNTTLKTCFSCRKGAGDKSRQTSAR